MNPFWYRKLTSYILGLCSECSSFSITSYSSQLVPRHLKHLRQMASPHLIAQVPAKHPILFCCQSYKERTHLSCYNSRGEELTRRSFPVFLGVVLIRGKEGGVNAAKGVGELGHWGFLSSQLCCVEADKLFSFLCGFLHWHV